MEDFFKDYTNTIAALAAFGTLAAVVVSLWTAHLALSANKTQLTASTDFRIIIGGHFSDSPNYLCVNVVNNGTLPLQLPYSFCTIRFPFYKSKLLLQPLDAGTSDPRIPTRQYPKIVEPRQSYLAFVSTEESISASLRATILRSGHRWRFRFPRVSVHTEDRMTFNAPLDSDVKKMFRDLVAEARGQPRTVERNEILAEDV